MTREYPSVKVKLWYVYPMEHYVTIKNELIAICTNISKMLNEESKANIFCGVLLLHKKNYTYLCICFYTSRLSLEGMQAY